MILIKLKIFFSKIFLNINPLTPIDPYSGRTAPPTSKRWILYIYSTNIGTEYLKHGINSPFFSRQNAVCFIILAYLVPVLFTFYIQGVLKLKKNRRQKVKFHEDPSSGSRVVPCRQTDRQTDRQGDKVQLTVAFRNVSKASKMVMNKYFTQSFFSFRIHVMWKQIQWILWKCYSTHTHSVLLRRTLCVVVLFLNDRNVKCSIWVVPLGTAEPNPLDSTEQNRTSATTHEYPATAQTGTATRTKHRTLRTYLRG